MKKNWKTWLNIKRKHFKVTVNPVWYSFLDFVTHTHHTHTHTHTHIRTKTWIYLTNANTIFNIFAKCYSKQFTNNNLVFFKSFDPHNDPKRQTLLLIPFY